MLRCLFWFSCCSWYIIFTTSAYSEVSGRGLLEFSKRETIVSEKIHYIPVGHHAKFTCETMGKFEFVSEKNSTHLRQCRLCISNHP
ncbi:hypothetical protein Y032_0056g2671 [Ancylostoma ceylanicum]|uniref:Secreted protein n=1 Tax=Ancylostoma ceylanicum TaxID=53326 RepID=A0A016U630_9BILA|nr:hypothetical protein Y032_0056g2671 [Ancylostoma ceylanicum]